jgi:hypothetical protein
MSGQIDESNDDISTVPRDNAGDGLTQAESQSLGEAARPKPPAQVPGRRLYCSDGVWYGPGCPPNGYKNPYPPGRPFKYLPFEQRGPCPPETRGEYRICDGQGHMLRAGISLTSLRRRMGEYMRSGLLRPGFSFEYQLARADARRADILYHEYIKLTEHQPPENTYHTDRQRASRSGPGTV